MSADTLIKTKHDYIFKIIIIGDSGVGKTNILFRYSQQHFDHKYVATIGIDFRIKTIEIGSKKVRLQIWDTAGQQRFRTITQNYYKGASGIMLVYSITDSQSFQNIKKWVKQINEKVSPHVRKILIGNKSDNENEREVTFAEGENLARELSKESCVTFMEVSAKKGDNIKQSFVALGQQIIKECQDNGTDGFGWGPRLSNSVKINNSFEEENDKQCEC